MAVLLELKENFKRFYNKYDIYIVPVAKFIAALVSFLMLNASIGYMDKLNSPIIAVLVSVICAFLPNGFTIVMLSIFMIAHLYAISVEFALIALCVVLLMYLLSKQIIEKNAQSISMTKILGFKNGEIGGLYIVATSIMVVISLVVSVPIVNALLKWAFSSYLYRIYPCAPFAFVHLNVRFFPFFFLETSLTFPGRPWTVTVLLFLLYWSVYIPANVLTRTLYFTVLPAGLSSLYDVVFWSTLLTHLYFFVAVSYL